MDTAEPAKKVIVVLGGSHNPCHPAHIETLDHAIKTLGADEGWLLFSQNPEKDPAMYESTHHRIEIAHLVAAEYPDSSFVMSNIEEELGTHITLDVMKGLRSRFPDCNFVWLMGADNLAGFHTWDGYEEFIETFSIVVLDRKGYTDPELNSVIAKTYPHLKFSDPKEMIANGKGWCFIDNPAPEMSSRDLRTDFRKGTKTFDKKFQKAADYIIDHKLYGAGGPLLTPMSDNPPAPAQGPSPL